MATYVRTIALVVVIYVYQLFITAECDNTNVSNYANSKVKCHSRGGLLTQKLLKFGGLMNISCELDVNTGVLTDGESVWVQGGALTGPYIALHTCMRFSNKDNYTISRTFYSNILYECSVFCNQTLHLTGYLGIYKDSCFCMHDSFKFHHTPSCLENDVMDRQKGIIVFRLTGYQLVDVLSKSEYFNCLGASIQESGKPSYYETKCASTLSSICTQRVDSDLSKNCLPRYNDFCFIEEKHTFLEHYRKCWLSNGTLIPFTSGILISLNYSVILGSFRAFKSVENDGENNSNADWRCLSIIQLNGSKYLEAENCSNKNSFICMDDMQDVSNEETKGGVTTHSVPIIILISLLIPTFTAIDIAIAIGIWWKCRRRRQCRVTSPKDAPHQSGEPEDGSPQAEIEEGEEDIPLYADSIITEAAYNPSQCVLEAQQSTNIYNHLQTWHDKDDDTYDTARFHKVYRRQSDHDRDLSGPNLPLAIVND